jgi:hypothetical protein
MAVAVSAEKDTPDDSEVSDPDVETDQIDAALFQTEPEQDILDSDVESNEHELTLVFGPSG